MDGTSSSNIDTNFVSLDKITIDFKLDWTFLTVVFKSKVARSLPLKISVTDKRRRAQNGIERQS